MKILWMIFIALPAFAKPVPNYTPECQVWSQKWRQVIYTPETQGKGIDFILAHLDPKAALALFQDYPGESPKPYLKGSESNLEKVHLRFNHPGCPILEFFDLGKALNQAKLTHEQTLQFRHALFESMRHDLQVTASSISLAVEEALIKNGVEKGKIHLNEAEDFEFSRLSHLVGRLKEQHSYQFKELCLDLNYCLPWTAEKTVKYYERSDDEMGHIRAEFGVWMDHVEQNKT